MLLFAGCFAITIGGNKCSYYAVVWFFVIIIAMIWYNSYCIIHHTGLHAGATPLPLGATWPPSSVLVCMEEWLGLWYCSVSLAQSCFLCLSWGPHACSTTRCLVLYSEHQCSFLTPIQLVGNYYNNTGYHLSTVHLTRVMCYCVTYGGWTKMHEASSYNSTQDYKGPPAGLNQLAQCYNSCFHIHVYILELRRQIWAIQRLYDSTDMYLGHNIIAYIFHQNNSHCDYKSGASLTPMILLP